MPGILSRMRVLNGLLGIRVGPGAAILPPEITKIHMNFAIKTEDGHKGPRRFWRNCLPRLKYWNPAVSMTVTRTTDQEGPATMIIHFTNPEAAASTDPAVSTTTSKKTSEGSISQTTSGPSVATTKEINMKNRLDSEILEALMRITKAREVIATPEELQQMREVDEENSRAAKDAQSSRAYLIKKKRDDALLARSQGAVG